MNLQTYLMIKQAATETFDPAKHLSGKDLEAYNAYNPKDVTVDANGRPTAVRTGNTISRVMAGDESTGPIMPNVADPKARRFVERYFGDVVLRDDKGNALKNDKGEERKGTRYQYTDYERNPYLNLHYGDAVDAAKGNIVENLHHMGYGGADLGGMRLGKTIGIDSIMDENGNYAGEGKPTGTIYIDDAGNILERSRGVVYGRRAGRIAGALGGGVGGYYGGNYLADKLGLNSENADGWKRFGGTLLRAGGALGGAYGGGWLGSRIGSGIGGWIDPQKGKAIRVRAMN